jgi:hypothetical protein
VGLCWPETVGVRAGREVSEAFGEVQRRHTTILTGVAA